MTDRYVYVKARVMRQQEQVLVVRLEDGFANAEANIHIEHVQEEGGMSDDLERLPRIMATEMSKYLRALVELPDRNSWLMLGPKELLTRLESDVRALKCSIRNYHDRVLIDCAAVASAAMMVADKADKLEPMPELIVDAEI